MTPTPEPLTPTQEEFLSHLREVNSARLAAWEGDDQKTDAIFHATELGGEVGEVLNVVKKLHREQMGWRGSRATKDQLAEEIGDVLICLDKLAAHYGIDLAEATAAKFNATSDKVGLPHKLARHRLLHSPAPDKGEEEAQAETYRAMHEIATKELGYPSILEALEAAPNALAQPADCPSSDLAIRCGEILSWRKTGIYEGHALQEMADRLEAEGRPAANGSMIRRAEEDTISEALATVANSTQPSGDAVLREALRLAQPIVEADLHAAIDQCDADWEGMSRTALEAINSALASPPVEGGEG